ncbi:MAG: M48 family metallopeptidase [Micromonosporaceae bacterium]
MSTTLRAVIAVALLVGFYVFAFAVVGVVAAVAFWAWTTHPGAAATKITIALVVVVVALVRAIWVVNRKRPAEEYGMPLTPQQAPDLWATVRVLAREVDTRAPDEIRLVADVNAAVSEKATLLGLRGGTRTLYVGLPLLLGLTVSQLRSVLAHELGHYSRSHTRLGEVTYRGRATVLSTVERLGRRSVIGWLFKGYAYLYLLVSQAVSRRQEYEADRASVRVAGRDTAGAALREVRVVDAAWGFFADNYVGYALESGYAPSDLFGGFAQLLRARSEELAGVRDAPPDNDRSRWDSHPSLAERLAAIERQPEVVVPADQRAAVTVLGAVDFWLAQAQRELLDLGDRTVLPWEQLTAEAVRERQRREAGVLHRVAARITGGTPALATTLDALAADRYEELFAELVRLRGQSLDASASSEELRGSLASEIVARLASGLAVAAVDSGAAYYRHSWTGPAELTAVRSGPLDLDRFGEYATDAYREARYVPELRRLLAAAQISEWPPAGAATSATPTAAGAELVAAVSDIKVNGVLRDLLVLDTGLISVPHPGKTRSGDPKARLGRLAASGAPSTLAGLEGNWFLPYEGIGEVVIKRKLPLTFHLMLRDGQTVELRQTLDSEELGEGFAALGSALGPMLRR